MTHDDDTTRSENAGIRPVATYDATGLSCPLPVLRTRKKLAELTPGDVLAVIATDPVAPIDMAHFCREAGHELILSKPEGTHYRFLIRRGPVE